MRTSKAKLNQSGFGLIEVIVTLFIMAVTLLLYQATSQTVLLNRYGRFREVALRVADQQMHNLRLTSFASIPSSGTFSDPQLASLPNGQGNIAVTDVNATLKEVTITVTWNNPRGSGTQQVELQTFIASGGLGQ